MFTQPSFKNDIDKLMKNESSAVEVCAVTLKNLIALLINLFFQYFPFSLLRSNAVI